MKSFQQYTEQYQSRSKEDVQQQMQDLIQAVDQVNELLEAKSGDYEDESLGQKYQQMVWQTFSDLELKLRQLKQSVERYLEIA